MKMGETFTHDKYKLQQERKPRNDQGYTVQCKTMTRYQHVNVFNTITDSTPIVTRFLAVHCVVGDSGLEEIASNKYSQ